MEESVSEPNLLSMKETTERTTRSSHPERLNPKAAATFGPAHDVQEIRGEHKGHVLPVHAQKVLGVAQDVPKVDVEQVPCQVPETEAQHQASEKAAGGSRLQPPWACSPWVLIMMLSLCRSPMPSTYVATQ